MMTYLMEELDLSNKSKALANKALKRASKMLGSIVRNKELYLNLTKLDDDKGNRYIEDNFNEEAFEKIGERLDKFTEEFESAGGNADQFHGMVFGSIFLNRELLKDMFKSCK